MGFLDVLGSALGKMRAMGQELESYKSEYESMSDYDLRREFENLKNNPGIESRDQRLIAIKSVFSERGSN